MDKGPQIRTIGNASFEKKEQARKKITDALFNHFESLLPEEVVELKKKEYPKSETELALIDFANSQTNKLMEEAGIEAYNIPPENYHIVPFELYKRLKGSSRVATALHRKQGVIFNAERFRDNPVYFGNVTLHETLHLKSHITMEVEEEGDAAKDTLFRVGISVLSSQKDDENNQEHEHFKGLNEAIVAETHKRISRKLIDLPELAREKEWLLSEEAEKLRKKIAEERKIPEDDIIWVGKNGEDDWEIVSYREHRKVLLYVCAEIQKQFSDQFKNTDDVYKEFLKAHLTGRLLVIARLVEKTFGESSFRLLGNMDTDRQSANVHMESLQKARTRQTRNKLT